MRLSFSSRSGLTLVELMISMLIFALVCISWFKIIAIQSARKEARRHEAVERLVGMMDASLYFMKKGDLIRAGEQHQSFIVQRDGDTINLRKGMMEEVYPIFDGDVSPIGYQIVLTKSPAAIGVPNAGLYEGWSLNSREAPYWLVGFLYDGCGNTNDVGRSFFTLPVFMMVSPTRR